jgi:hypothetical protein
MPWRNRGCARTAPPARRGRPAPRSASAPVTTVTDVQREASAAFTARRSIGTPPTGCSSLLAPPMRRLLPAASTSAATLGVPAGTALRSPARPSSSSSGSSGLRIRPPTPMAMISARPSGRPASMRCSTQSRPFERRERAQPGRMSTGTVAETRQQQHVARLDRHAEMVDLAAGGDDGGGHRVGAVLGHGGTGNQQQVAAGGPRFAQLRRRTAARVARSAAPGRGGCRALRAGAGCW